VPKPDPKTPASFVPPDEPDVRNYSTETEWLTARLDGIGASEVAGVLGLSRFQGPFSIAVRKIARTVEQAGERSPEAEAGHRHEPTIAKWFQDVCDDPELPDEWGVEDPGEFCTFWRPPLFCTPDRRILAIQGPIAVLQLKAAWYRQAKRFNDALPMEYRVQVQTEMHCTALQRAYFGVLLNGMEFRWYREDYHAGVMQSILRKVENLWAMIQRKELPPTDFSEATSRALAAHYDEPSDERVDLGPEFVNVHSALVKAKAAEKAADRAKRAAENQIKGAMGNATLGVLPDGDTGYSWKPNKNGKRTTLREVKVRDGD
jgi:predicted phage-related endonuclease